MSHSDVGTRRRDRQSIAEPVASVVFRNSVLLAWLLIASPPRWMLKAADTDDGDGAVPLAHQRCRSRRRRYDCWGGRYMHF